MANSNQTNSVLACIDPGAMYQFTGLGLKAELLQVAEHIRLMAIHEARSAETLADMPGDAHALAMARVDALTDVWLLFKSWGKL